jgi:hypothetical protein
MSKELRQLEQELGIDILPGAEVMTDIGSHRFIQEHRRCTRTSAIQIGRLSPAQPVPASPLLKDSVLLLVSAFPFYMQAFDCSLAQAIQFTGVSILVSGFSEFLWYLRQSSIIIIVV